MLRFPRTVFVDINLVDRQIEHVSTEVVEAYNAMDESPLRVVEELLDVIHSAESGIRIMIEKNPEIDLPRVIDHIIEKNRNRGYYGKKP